MTESEPPAEGQRREATVLFADVAGFTAMSERLDPEDVTQVMNACFEMVERIVCEHGGTVDKYIGDCVMAIFGAPHAIEHAAERAVSAALAIRSGLVSFNDAHELPVRLEVHSGINSGLVIAGGVGGHIKKDYTVMGDTVNLASRLEDASEKGQILVGPRTFAYTRDSFEYRELPPLSLKGKARAVQAYEVLSVKQRPAAPKLAVATRQISAELVGRDAEVVRLQERISSFLSGEGGIVSIVGEAGIGKSRLLAELGKRRDLESALVLVGRCDAIGSQLGYLPFVTLLQDWSGIKAGDPEDTASEKLEAAVRETFPEGHGEVFPFIATLMGVRPRGEHAARVEGIEAEAMEKLVLKAMGDLLTRLAAGRPLLLVFEDLHWADRSSVKLLESLLRLAATQRILFVFAFRPGFNETSERLLDVTRKRYGDRNLEIALQPLSERSAGVLIRRLLKVDDVPNAAREMIARKAEGNPLFIEEVIRALIDQGAIEIEDDALVVTDKVESATIPATIQEVISVRVEQLDASARRLLEIGSVIGRSFYHRIVRELLGPDFELEATLATLRERQVLEERTVRRTGSVRRHTLAGEREHVFKHALIQETIYRSLLNRVRKRLHLRVAETIEAMFQDRLADFFGMLAYHYSHAESFENAERYLLLAGEEAVRAAASSEALHYFREAHRVYRLRHGDGGDRQKRAILEKNLATALLLTGNLAESRPHFDRALEYLGERVPRTRRQAYRQLATDFARLLTRIYLSRGRMPSRPCSPQMREAIGLLYNRARAESVADPEWFLFDSMYMTGRLTTVDPTTFDEAFAEWAGVALMFSYSGLSFDLSRRVSHVARAVLRPERIGDLITYHLMSFMRDYFEGRWSEPCGIDDDLIERVTRTGKLWDVDTFLGMDAEKQIDLGNFPAAEKRLRQIDTLVTEYGYGFAETNQQAIPIFLALAHRRLDEALEKVERYAERPEEMLNLIALGTKARIQILRGDLDGAGATLQQADALVHRMRQRPFGRPTPFHSGAYRGSHLLYAVVQLERALAGPDPAVVRPARRRAAVALRAALRTASRMARLRTETYRLAGTYLWLLGRAGGAARWWQRSIEEGARLGARPELARTHAEIGQRLACGEGERTRVAGRDAAEHLTHAADSFAAMGLDWDLRRVESIRAGRRAA
ncbi:MAG: adenylate/guanylate cyclase domain-containing protein [Thermodesulfobacteriota bacterium]